MSDFIGHRHTNFSCNLSTQMNQILAHLVSVFVIIRHFFSQFSTHLSFRFVVSGFKVTIQAVAIAWSSSNDFLKFAIPIL